uniref:Saposin B-type domain-containing protein n=1 Tax=Panagrellus redivivus TaxID=6233 RepID=A0A7E4V7B9_PANRE
MLFQKILVLHFCSIIVTTGGISYDSPSKSEAFCEKSRDCLTFIREKLDDSFENATLTDFEYIIKDFGDQFKPFQSVFIYAGLQNAKYIEQAMKNGDDDRDIIEYMCA